MYKFKYTKAELEKDKEEALLSDLQSEIIRYRVLGYSINEMSFRLHCSPSKISKELNKAILKIQKLYKN